MSQSHFTLSFPLIQGSDAKLLSDRLTTMMPALFKAEDSIGTIHYSRFTLLSERTLLFLGDFDGEFGQLMSELAMSAEDLAVRPSRHSMAHHSSLSTSVRAETWRSNAY